MKAKKILILIDILLIICTVVFILSNSSASSDRSNKTSQDITDSVIENVKPLEDAIDQNKIEKSDVHRVVRKMAHVLEYALLGVETALLLLLIWPADFSKYLIYTHFFALALGVCDETVQRFNDRTSSTTDVIRDFGGFCLGTAAALIVSGIVAWKSKKKVK